MTEPEKPPVEYAPFTSRMLAGSIDALLVITVSVPITNWFLDLVFPPLDLNDIYSLASHQNTLLDPRQFFSELWRIMNEKGFLLRGLCENILQGVFFAAYTLPFWFRYGATPGKMLFRMQIQDINTGNGISRKQAILRFFGYIISFLPLGLGFIWISFNRKREAFHDIIANTAVVIKQKVKNIPHNSQMHPISKQPQ